MKKKTAQVNLMAPKKVKKTELKIEIKDDLINVHNHQKEFLKHQQPIEIPKPVKPITPKTEDM